MAAPFQRTRDKIGTLPQKPGPQGPRLRVVHNCMKFATFISVVISGEYCPFEMDYRLRPAVLRVLKVRNIHILDPLKGIATFQATVQVKISDIRIPEPNLQCRIHGYFGPDGLTVYGPPRIATRPEWQRYIHPQEAAAP